MENFADFFKIAKSNFIPTTGHTQLKSRKQRGTAMRTRRTCWLTVSRLHQDEVFAFALCVSVSVCVQSQHPGGDTLSSSQSSGRKRVCFASVTLSLRLAGAASCQEEHRLPLSLSGNRDAAQRTQRAQRTQHVHSHHRLSSWTHMQNWEKAAFFCQRCRPKLRLWLTVGTTNTSKRMFGFFVPS